jgi:hypothetical protein
MGLRTVVALSGAICALSAAATASTMIDVTDVAMNNPAAVNISGPGIDEEVYASAFLFTTSTGSIMPVFCVDIWHDINLGPANILYKEAPLANDSSGALSGTGAALSTAQIGEIGGLADLGFDLVHHGDANLATDLAGIQAAIWSIEYPAVTISGDADVTSRMSFYEDWAQTHQATDVLAIYDVNGAVQGQVVGVPEPVSWSLMIIGIGAVGGALRRSRLTPARI